MGVDLTKGFYFSFTYHLAATLQCNYQAGLAGAAAAAAASNRSNSTSQPSQQHTEGAYVSEGEEVLKANLFCAYDRALECCYLISSLWSCAFMR